MRLGVRRKAVTRPPPAGPLRPWLLPLHKPATRQSQKSAGLGSKNTPPSRNARPKPDGKLRQTFYQPVRQPSPPAVVGLKAWNAVVRHVLQPPPFNVRPPNNAGHDVLCRKAEQPDKTAKLRPLRKKPVRLPFRRQHAPSPFVKHVPALQQGLPPNVPP